MLFRSVLYRRLILVSFTGWNNAPNPSNCIWTAGTDGGSGIRYEIGSTPAPGMISLLNEIQQPSSGLSDGADVAGFTFYSSGSPGSNACSTTSTVDLDTVHVEARNWFNTQNVSQDDLIAVVGHSYGGNRARYFVDYLKSTGFTTNFLGTVDPVDWAYCNLANLFPPASAKTDCLQAPPASGPPTVVQQPRPHAAKTALSFYQPNGYRWFSVDNSVVVFLLTGYTLQSATVIREANDYHGDIDSDESVHSAIMSGLSNVVNSPPASPVVSVVPGTPLRVNGSISVPVKLSVTGKATATVASIVTATLNGVAASGTPIQVGGDIPAGASSGITNLVFPGSAATAGATVQLTVAGRYSYYGQPYYSQLQFTSTLRIKVP